MCARKLFVVCGALMLSTLTTASADTIPGGNVSGTWYQANSPYYITGDITIGTGSTLSIEPSVEVIFLGLYKLTVEGWLEAVGTETDSIHFFPADTTTRWYGMYFQTAQDSSHLSYCTIRYATYESNAGGAMHMANSNPVITHCNISDNIGQHGGAVQLANGSSPAFSYCTFSRNHSIWNGGAIYIRFLGVQSPVISHCLISDNTGDLGGGLYSYSGMPTISHCAFSGNMATEATPTEGGGGIYVQAPDDLTVSYCTFTGNTSEGGGICVGTNSHMDIDHCTMDGNIGFSQGSAVLATASGASAALTNTCVTNNNTTALTGAINVSYSDFYGNTNNGSGTGPLVQVNANGDSCDANFNIYLDPLYEDQPGGNFQITWANFPVWDSTRSPCIDAGDPAYPYDPDSTITDIGRYFFDQRAPDIELSASLLDFGTVTIGQQADLPLVIYNIGNDTLELYDIACSLSVFSTDWNPSQNMVPPGDSLSILVSFAPDDTISYEDTLWIDNSDELTGVQLLGEGRPITGVTQDSPRAVGESVELQCSNLCNSPGRIRFALPKSCEVTLSLYDITGRLVATLADGWHGAGVHEAALDSKNFSQGVYFLRFEAGRTCMRRKLILLR